MLRKSITNELDLNNISQEDNDIGNLKTEIIKLKLENSNLRKKINYYKFIENELKNEKNQIVILNKEKYELMMKQCDEIRNYKLEMEKLLNERDFHQLNYNKRLIIFEQKMAKVNELEMENEVYRDELKDLKEKNKELEEKTGKKLKELEITNELKFKKIKNKVINDLKEAKQNMLQISLDHMNINSKLIYLKNNKYIKNIEEQNQGIRKLTDENNKLRIKILDLEGEKKANENVQLDLANKLNNKNKNGNNSLDTNLFNKKNKKKNKRYFNLKKNFFIKNSEKFLNSLIFNDKASESRGVSLDNKSKKKEKDEISFKNSEIKTKINFIKKNKNKNENNTLSKTEYNSNNIKSESLTKDLIEDYQKSNYKQIIKEKNFEIENLYLKIDRLKNKISFFINKYRKLYDFLEECMNNFFKEIKNEKHFNINYEELIKFDFSRLKEREKYSVLILLMNRLIPLITFNFDSNCNLGNNVFTTNINIFDKSFNKTHKHLTDDILKKSFFGKNNKLQKDLFIRNDILFNGSIPVLRKNTDGLFNNNNKLKDDKYKYVL